MSATPTVPSARNAETPPQGRCSMATPLATAPTKSTSDGPSSPWPTPAGVMRRASQLRGRTASQLQQSPHSRPQVSAQQLLKRSVGWPLMWGQGPARPHEPRSSNTTQLHSRSALISTEPIQATGLANERRGPPRVDPVSSRFRRGRRCRRRPHPRTSSRFRPGHSVETEADATPGTIGRPACPSGSLPGPTACRMRT